MVVFDRGSVEIDADLSPAEAAVSDFSGTIEAQIHDAFADAFKGAADAASDAASSAKNAWDGALDGALNIKADFDAAVDAAAAAGGSVIDSFSDAAASAKNVLQKLDPEFNAVTRGALAAGDAIVSAMGSAAAAAGRALANGLSSALDGVKNLAGNIASGIGSALQTSLSTVGATAGGVLSASLFTGYQRFTQISDATASLGTALGDAAVAGDLLDEVMGVVTGTPYDFNQFADAASMMVNFGVEAEKVPQYLTAIGEASAGKGARAQEYVGRLATTMGQVASMGRITNAEINEMAFAGVDALAILGNSFGVTTADMRDMVSDGVVPADEALDILTTGMIEGTTGINGATVALGGQMEALRDTLSGSMGGVRSASARFGAAIVEQLEGPLIAGAQAAQTVFDALGDAVRGSLSGDTLAGGLLDQLTDFLEGIEKADVTKFINELGNFKSLVAPLAAITGAAGLGAISAALGPLGALIPTVTGPLGFLVVALGALALVTPEIREAFGGMGDLLSPLGDSIGGILDPLNALADDVGQALAEMFEVAIPVAVDFATTLVDVFDDMIEPLSDLVGELGPALGDVFVGLEAILSPVAELIGDLLIGAFEGLGEVAGDLGDSFSSFGDSTGGLIDALSPLSDILGVLIVGAAETLMGVLDGVGAAFDSLVSSGAIEALATGLSDLVEGVASFVAGFGEALGDAIAMAAGPIGEMAEALGRMGTALGNVLESDFAGWLLGVAGELGGAILGGIANLVTFVADLSTGLLNVGKSSEDFEAALDEHQVATFAEAIKGADDAIGAIVDTMYEMDFSDFYAGMDELEEKMKVDDYGFFEGVGKAITEMLQLDFSSVVFSLEEIGRAVSGNAEWDAFTEDIEAAGGSVEQFIEDIGGFENMDVGTYFRSMGTDAGEMMEILTGGQPAIQAWGEEMALAGQSPEKVAVGMNIMTEALDSSQIAIDAYELEKIEEEQEKMDEAIEQSIATIDKFADAMVGLADGFDEIQADAFTEAWETIDEGSESPYEAAMAFLEVASNMEALQEAAADTGGALDGLKLNLDLGTEGGLKFAESMAPMVAGLKESTAEILANGGSFEDAQAGYDDFWASIQEGLDITPEMTAELQELFGMSQEDFDAVLKLTTELSDEAMFDMLFSALSGDLSSEQVVSLIGTYKDEGAEAAIEQIQDFAEIPLDQRLDLDTTTADEKLNETRNDVLDNPLELNADMHHSAEDLGRNLMDDMQADADANPIDVPAEGDPPAYEIIGQEIADAAQSAAADNPVVVEVDETTGEWIAVGNDITAAAQEGTSPVLVDAQGNPVSAASTAGEITGSVAANLMPVTVDAQGNPVSYAIIGNEITSATQAATGVITLDSAADPTGAQGDLSGIETGDYNANVDVDANDEATGEISDIESGSYSATIDIEGNDSDARSDIRAITNASYSATVTIKANLDSAYSALEAFERAARQTVNKSVIATVTQQGRVSVPSTVTGPGRSVSLLELGSEPRGGSDSSDVAAAMLESMQTGAAFGGGVNTGLNIENATFENPVDLEVLARQAERGMRRAIGGRR